MSYKWEIVSETGFEEPILVIEAILAAVGMFQNLFDSFYYNVKFIARAYRPNIKINFE